jgi:hypothetical protein
VKLKDGDVNGLIKIKNHIQETIDKEDYLQLKQDEINATLRHLEREGIPAAKHDKILKKIKAAVDELHESCKVVEKDIGPLIQREADIYQKKIAEFEMGLKDYQGGLRKEA